MKTLVRGLGRIGFGLFVTASLASLAMACSATTDEDVGEEQSEVTRAGMKATRFLHTRQLDEGNVTFCLTRHPLDKAVIKLARCDADQWRATDADTFQVVSDLARGGVFAYDGVDQLVFDTTAKKLSFGKRSACKGTVACVEGNETGLVYFDPTTHKRRALVAAMPGAPHEDDVASGANNALDVHLRVADLPNLNPQIVTRDMAGLAKRCVIENGVDSCGGTTVCRLESADKCKTRCPFAAGEELWSCLAICDRQQAPNQYYERLGYCGPKNIIDRCQDGDPNVVACSGSQLWAGGFDCKTHTELFRCDDGQTCRSFVNAVASNGQRKSNEQLKAELCKTR